MMTKEIQMGEDQIITDEVHDKFRLNEDPESERPLRMPVRWRHLFPASVIKKASGDAMQSRIRITREWRELRAEYCLNAKEQKAVGISQKSRRRYNPYRSCYSNDPCYSVAITKWPLHINTGLDPSILTCDCQEGKKRMDYAVIRRLFYTI